MKQIILIPTFRVRVSLNKKENGNEEYDGDKYNSDANVKKML